MLTQNLQGILEQYLNITGIHKLFLALKIRQLRKSGKVLMFYTVHVTCTVLQYMDTVIIRQKKKNRNKISITMCYVTGLYCKKYFKSL